jgi:hypothetical protein
VERGIDHRVVIGTIKISIVWKLEVRAAVEDSNVRVLPLPPGPGGADRGWQASCRPILRGQHTEVLACRNASAPTRVGRDAANRIDAARIARARRL